MAAVAFDESYPYDGGDAVEDAWREMFRALGSGVVADLDNELQVAVDTGRNIQVKTGRMWAAGEFGKVTAAKTGIAISANASGNPRIDRVIVRNNFTTNQIEIDVKTGTPGVTPVAPALVSNGSMQEFSLARIGPLASGFTNVSGGNIHDERCFLSLYADAAFADAAARDLWQPTPKPGFAAFVRDTGGLYRYTGTTWQQILRVVAHVTYDPSGDDATATNATWPNGLTGSVDVPAWATRMWAVAKLGQIHDLTATANVDVQFLLDTLVIDDDRIRWAAGVDANSERDITLLGDIDVSSVAGTTVTLRTLGNIVSGTGVLHADSESSSAIVAEFR